MMFLYYDEESKCFFHGEDGQYFWGRNKVQIPFGTPPSPHSFLMKKTGEKLGPLVGILTSTQEPNHIEGNKGTFQRIQSFLQIQGGVSIVLTPFSLRNSSLKGYLFLPQLKKWVITSIPYPDVIYNRIPFREGEQQLHMKETIQALKAQNIPFFNPGFFDKYAIYKALIADSSLKKHLPPTILLRNKSDLNNFLFSYPNIYIKNRASAQGDGIFQLSKQDDTLLCRRIGQQPTLISLDDMWSKLIPMAYIAQQTIHCQEIHGQKYDLRVLAHFINHEFIISGIGIRVAKKDEIATHISNGGSILEISSLEEQIDSAKIALLVKTCGDILRTSYGSIYEFSMDIGIGLDREYYIFEINAKPMVFDEEDIKLQGLQHLRHIFDELAIRKEE